MFNYVYIPECADGKHYVGFTKDFKDRMAPIEEPVLYFSAYLVKHKTEYYQLLRGVSEKNNWQDWVMYILTARPASLLPRLHVA